MYWKLSRKLSLLASKCTCILYAISAKNIGDKHENDNDHPISSEAATGVVL